METIKSSAEISRLFEEGKRIHTPELSLIVLCNEGQHDHNGRVAFIAGKKLGNAVWRNGAKRRMREICRKVGGSFPHYDVAFVARRGILESDFHDVYSKTSHALMRAGLISSE